MLTVLKRGLLLALLLGTAPVPAAASLLTWEFYGTTSGYAFTDIPNGTPISVAWTFDTEEPNRCAHFGGPWGIYGNQHVSVTIGNSLTYTASGILTVGVRNVGCGAFEFPDLELRLGNWSGPNLSDAVLLPFGIGAPPGMFWVDPFHGGRLPAVPPLSAMWLGPVFQLTTVFGIHPVQAQLSPVPEPAGAVLIMLGCAATWVHRKRQRGRW